MDFFEHQEKARKRTHLLIFYFALALVGIVLAVYSLSVVVFYFAESDSAKPDFHLWQPETLLISAIATGIVVFSASSFKTLQLAGGGEVIARELGGREVDTNTTDFHERRLLNVIEEMAIASGVPVPKVFVMDREESINAFAAGKTTSDAVIGVTRGCMTLLTRDELQGVMAHEFSHILNGDMRLNIRLIGLLFGILFLALIGSLIMRMAFHSGRRDGAIAFGLVGLGLYLIGYVGNFFARLIQASVSRQREFLADASAVQFTRNPEGIAGALRKIGGLAEHSDISHPMAADASHLFFGSAFSSQLFATHPPLQTRIHRLLPHWNGEFGAVSLPAITAKDEPSKKTRKKAPPLPGMFLDGGGGELRLSDKEALESMRSLHPEQVELGRDILEGIPSHWITACRSQPGAQAMILALLLAQDEQLREVEMNRLRSATDPDTSDAAAQYFDEVHSLHSAIKLALIDLAIPTLRKISRGEYERFRKIVSELIASDRQVDLFEFSLLQVVTRHLDQYFRNRDTTRIKHRHSEQLREETAILLSTLAAMSHEHDENEMQNAFREAAAVFRTLSGTEVSFKPGTECSLDRIEKSLESYAHASPILKRNLLQACSKSVLTDGAVSSREAELIRAIADAIGCPIPPFVRTAPLK